ncbi:hypothetical protein ACJJTC_006008 [Scirpophaga incertulas]
MSVKVFGVLLAVLGCAYAHTYHLGACPIVEPMPEFDMNRMLGLWYVIQKTSTASHCITYNFSRTDEPYKYQLEQESQHFILGLTPLKHDYRYTGILTVPDLAVPARMKVRFPLSKIVQPHTQCWPPTTRHTLPYSRARSWPSHTVVPPPYSPEPRLWTRCSLTRCAPNCHRFGVDPYDLSIISQSNCPKHNTSEGVNINIDPETFSSHNIGEAVRKTGGAIADGVEYVVEAGKKVYHKVASSKEDLTETPTHDAERNFNSDAEWLP